MELSKVSNKAEEIARAYNPDGLSPFPYEKIQEDRKDLDIFLADLKEEISGAILYDQGKNRFNIFVNKKKSETRQYFTIAHELGHYFLHQDIIKEEEGIIDGDNSLDGNQILYRLDIKEQNRMETEANNFAASLIMPKELIIRAWEISGSVEECAKIFRVSVPAMSVRLEKMGLVN